MDLLDNRHLDGAHVGGSIDCAERRGRMNEGQLLLQFLAAFIGAIVGTLLSIPLLVFLNKVLK